MTERRKRKEKKGGILSVWALLSRCSFYKIAAVLFLMILAECVSFAMLLQERQSPDSLEAMIDYSLTPMIFLAALGFTFGILSLTGGRLDSKSRYTLMRLRLSKPQLFLVRLAFNILCLVMVFAVQIALAFWMVRLYKETFDPPHSAERLLFLTFYRNTFLHCLLPMAETGKWVRNLLLLLAFGTEACAGEKNRGVTQISLFIMTACWFIGPIGPGYRDIICEVVYIVVIAGNIIRADLFRSEHARNHSAMRQSPGA